MVNPQYEYCTWHDVYRLHSTIFYYYFFWCLAAQLIVLWVQFTPGLWPTNGEMLVRDPGRLHLTCSAQTTTVCLTVSLSTAFSWPHILPTSILQQIVRNIFYQQNNAGQRVWRKKKKYNTASPGPSRRTAWAPRLSCLYKQALIFLSSPGTSAIYSQYCGRGPGGAGEILLQST